MSSIFSASQLNPHCTITNVNNALYLFRLCLNNVARSLTNPPQLLFHSTPVLCGEPIKKKKKIDPAVLRAREERRKRKLEKQIRRLQKNARQLKPIEEMEVPFDLVDQRK